ncbi:hypothetical protein HT136_21560 [Novosphingobium profundi]|uniref:DUF6356 family protein n=1 Tax=Novosphingobium profundi TaxID=1774954 RepID=UPI001BD97F58|nr:DUF6356 family protein [Novosphingobium profundi]MBT0670962.1 hypothetical protein [Novosphingobium profundi]
MLRKIFNDHPQSVGETYPEHARSAFGFGLAMLQGGAKCLVHGIFPPLFKTSGSDVVRRLHERMVVHRRKAP